MHPVFEEIFELFGMTEKKSPIFDPAWESYNETIRLEPDEENT